MRPAAVAGVVLAAGQGRRFGGFKALTPVGGRSMLARAVGALREAGVERVLVVANPGWALPEDVGEVEVLVNDAWAEGMGSSLRLALSADTVTGADAVVLVLADMPGVTAACVGRVVAGADGADALVQATYDGRRAHPVLIGRAHVDGVRRVARADAGAREYLGAHQDRLRLVECGDVGDPADVDTREDLARLESVQRLRQICLSLPETTERLSHGEPTWFVRGRTSFATLADHHHDDRLAFWCAAPPGSAPALVVTDPVQFFIPPYVGGRGWLGVRLDVDLDWDQVALLVEDAYRSVAPKRLVALL